MYSLLQPYPLGKIWDKHIKYGILMSQISFPNSDISLLPTDMPVILDWADNIGQGYLNLFFFFLAKFMLFLMYPSKVPNNKAAKSCFLYFYWDIECNRDLLELSVSTRAMDIDYFFFLFFIPFPLLFFYPAYFHFWTLHHEISVWLFSICLSIYNHLYFKW